MLNKKAHNARLRGWQRIKLNSNATTVTTAAHWDCKRNALTVPLEAFVMCPPYSLCTLDTLYVHLIAH
ncbi:conserved hypothetical protein [Vibrio cholerae MAK 757]|nr:conserved hypothetical protein [Vibrio cholerae MAK 757]